MLSFYCDSSGKKRGLIAEAGDMDDVFSNSRHSGPRARVLFVSTSHEGDAGHLRSGRGKELALHLGDRGIEVDQLLLVERTLAPLDRARLAALRGRSVLHVVHATEGGSWTSRLFRNLLPLRARVVGESARSIPEALVHSVRKLHRRRGYDVLIVRGPGLSSLPRHAALGIDTLFDVRRLQSEVSLEAFRSLGRDDCLDGSRTLDEACPEWRNFDAFMAASPAEASRVIDHARRMECLVVPPVGLPVEVSPEPPRPRRILIVASEAAVQLDGLRLFRRRVLPEVLRAVPGCRVRIVGESGRHIEPGDDLERIGRLPNLDAEYRDASVVLIPHRVGGGLRRNIVSALSSGRALAMHSAAALDCDLMPGRDALIARGEKELVRGLIAILTDDETRRRLERRSLEIARERFAPDPALSQLGAWIASRFASAGSELQTREATPVATPEIR